MTRTFYSNITSPGEAEPDSDHEDGGAADTSIQADVSMEVDDEPEGRGVSEAVDEESAAAKKKRGGYMREGPTTYKLIKPVLKAIKEAESLEYVVCARRSLSYRADFALSVEPTGKSPGSSWSCPIERNCRTTTKSSRIQSHCRRSR